MIGVLFTLALVFFVASWLTGSALLGFLLTGAYFCARMIVGTRRRLRAEAIARAEAREAARRLGWPL